MRELVAIAVGGSIGAMLRYLVTTWINAVTEKIFPLGTLVVNGLGSFIAGVVFVIVSTRLDIAPELRLLVMVGGLGAFTTFSTFSIETLVLIERQEVLKASAYVAASVILCLTAAWGGMLVGKKL